MWGFAVATAEEAHELRQAGLGLPDGILTREELVEALINIRSTLNAR